MKVDEISKSRLQYGDLVKTKRTDSKLSNLVGKIVEISTVSAQVKFEGMKKPQLIMLDALERA